MIEPIKSWFQENQTMVLFLAAQAIAIGAAAAAILAYSVKLETRVYTMETRGAELHRGAHEQVRPADNGD